MSRNPQQVSTTGTWALAATLLNAIVLQAAITGSAKWYGALLLTAPLMGAALVQLVRQRRNLKRR